MTHTGFQNQPYWEVDLDDMSRIDSIVIYNRSDCCGDRLKDGVVEVFDRSLSVIVIAIDRRVDTIVLPSLLTVGPVVDTIDPRRRFGSSSLCLFDQHC